VLLSKFTTAFFRKMWRESRASTAITLDGASSECALASSPTAACLCDHQGGPSPSKFSSYRITWICTRSRTLSPLTPCRSGPPLYPSLLALGRQNACAAPLQTFMHLPVKGLRFHRFCALYATSEVAGTLYTATYAPPPSCWIGPSPPPQQRNNTTILSQ
jgi:hypothetical protein